MNAINMIEVRVRSVRWECRDVYRIELEPVSGLLPKLDAGAHVDLDAGVGVIRQYSLTLGSSQQRYVLGVRRERHSRGGSSAIHEKIRPGQVVKISEPRNTFPLQGDGPIHLLAGGIGVTPILLMASELARSERQWSLTYCVRTLDDAAFLDEVLQLGGRLHVDFDEGLPNLPELIAAIPFDSHIYCCGPGPMLDAFVEACSSRPQEMIHVERFEPAALRAGEGEFVIELARSGKQFVVPSDKTILDVLLTEGVAAEHSCRVGVCGTCETRVLSGKPDHRDLVLTEEEHAEGLMMICCSRAHSERLVLEI